MGRLGWRVRGSRKWYLSSPILFTLPYLIYLPFLSQTMYSDVAGATEPVHDLDRVCHLMPVNLILGKIKDFMYVSFSPYSSGFPTNGINKCTMIAPQKYTKPSHHQPQGECTHQ